MKKRFVFNITLIIFVLFVYFISTPNINPIYKDGAFFDLFIISLFVVVNLILLRGNLVVSQNAAGAFKINFEKGSKGIKLAISVLVVIWGIFIIVNLLSTPLINYKAYKNQFGESTPTEFKSDIQPYNINKLPIVDKPLAAKLADKKLGEKPSLGSQVTLGEPTIQNVNNDLVWVVPLNHSGFFKWLTNQGGTPGYIIVSATNENDVKYIENFKIKYQPGAFFFDSLARKSRFADPLKGLTDYSFELDDSGNPYWIITTYKNKWLYSLPEADGILLVNATSGKTEKYGISNLPKWIDRVQPEAFVIAQLDNKGRYVHGVFNFSNKDKFQSSQGYAIVYNEGRCYLFTGLTSVGTDESAIGFEMVNMVTKESKQFRINGATEYSAQKSAEGKVQQFGYRASFPLIINIEGQPTFFMTLKDNEGLIKQFAFVSVKNYSTVGTGETINTAVKNYQSALKNTGYKIETGGQAKKLTGVISRISQEINDGSTTYKMLVLEKSDTIFLASSDLSNELALTQVGDKITVEYMDINSNSITVTSFDNLNIKLK